MLQELFRIPFIDRPVYGYGLMLVIGFLLAAQLAKYLARRAGFNGEHFVNAGLLALISGVIGARLSHVLESVFTGGTEFAHNNRSAWDNFLSMINVSSGGLTFYGGFLLATPVLIFYAIKKRIPVLRGMDIIAPCLMIGLGFGRIGCFFNGCCYGERCDLSVGVHFPYGSNAFVEQYEKGELNVPAGLLDATHAYADGRPRLLTKAEIARDPKLVELAAHTRALPVHPTEIYSAFNAFFIAGVLMAFYTLSPTPGRVFALMLLMKGASRFVLEMIRVEPPVWGPLSFSMVLSIGLFVAGMLLWFFAPQFERRAKDRVVGAVAAA